MARRLIAGAVLAALWLVFGLGPYALQAFGNRVATLAALIPSPMRGGVFGLPLGWAIAVHTLTAVLITVAFAVIVTWFSRGRRVSFAAGWIAAVLTGFTVGIMLDVGDTIVGLVQVGIRGALAQTGAAVSAVFWALLAGWVPALIAAGSRGRAEATSPVSPPTQPEPLEPRAQPGPPAQPGPLVWSAPPERPSRPPGLTALTVVAVVAALALPVAAQSAHAVAQANLVQAQADAQAQAEANADPGGADSDGAAPADPQAEGIPVPTVAPSASPLPKGACTTATTTMRALSPDAATGHRVQPLQIMNTGAEPCTVDGYPDIALGDQNDHELPVTVVHGSSFMATDPGAQSITLQPGQTASAAIGWDANSVQGQLVARSLWLAPRVGQQREPWERDVSLDIIPGTTVYVTAWATDAPAAG